MEDNNNESNGQQERRKVFGGIRKSIQKGNNKGICHRSEVSYSKTLTNGSVFLFYSQLSFDY